MFKLLNNTKQNKPLIYHFKQHKTKPTHGLPLTFTDFYKHWFIFTLSHLFIITQPWTTWLSFEQCTDKTNQQPNSKSCKCHSTSLFLNLVNTFQTSFNFSPYWHLTLLLDFSDPSLLWLSSYISAPCFCRALSGSSSFTLSLNVTESKGLASKLLLSSLYMFSLGNVIRCPVLNYRCLYANDSVDVVQPGVYSIASDHIPKCLFDLLWYLWPVGQKCSTTDVSLWMEG